MPKDKRLPGEWAVFDTNARTIDHETGKGKPRTHESRMGKAWPLRFDEPCYMPEADARVFLKDPAFRVLDAGDEHVPSLAAVQMSRKLPDTLGPEFVVANVAELTIEALLTRAAQRDGGHKFTAATHRSTLVNFLVEGQERTERTARRDTGVGDGDVEDLDDAAAAKMLQGA